MYVTSEKVRYCLNLFSDISRNEATTLRPLKNGSMHIQLFIVLVFASAILDDDRQKRITISYGSIYCKRFMFEEFRFRRFS